VNSSVYTIIKDLFGITGTDGFSAKEIEQVRNLYGKIPLALELYYREVGRNEQVNQTQNNLIVPWKYSWAKSESHLIIYAETKEMTPAQRAERVNKIGEAAAKKYGFKIVESAKPRTI